jgi:glycosyltransferase involved in cell wall biosynthesis
MPMADSSAQRPIVSVVVPARNEAGRLEICLSSLVNQRGIDFEIIVVDDASTDRTREIAQSFSDVRVIEAPPLSRGWTGKNNALVAGAAEARGEWLLFTDADTMHLPGSLARSAAEANRQRAALLSYSPEQQVQGFWEKAVMPVIFAELAATYPPALISNPKSSAAAANGQYILILREAYDAVGGHAAIAGNLLEDVALARAVKNSRRKILFRYGGDAVRTRMYSSLSQVIEGWTKNLVLLFPSPLRLATLRLLEFVLIAFSIGITASSVLHRRNGSAVMCGLLALLLISTFLRRIHQAHFHRDANALAIFGLPLFSYLLWRSHISYKKGLLSWKGRIYGSGFSADGETVADSHTRPNMRLIPPDPEERDGLLNPQS